MRSRFAVALAAVFALPFAIASTVIAADTVRAPEPVPIVDLQPLADLQAVAVDYASIARSCEALPGDVFAACVETKVADALRIPLRPSAREHRADAAPQTPLWRRSIHPPDSAFGFPPYRSPGPTGPDLRTA